MRKIIILLFISLSASLFAQGGLSFLRENSNIRNAGMGNVHFGSSKTMFLYSNPTSFLNENVGNIYTSYSLGILPADKQIQLFNTFSAGYKQGKNAFLIGTRYLKGTKVDAITDDGQFYQIHNYDFSFDMAYARAIGYNLSAYVQGSVVKSYIGRSGYTGTFSTGLYYDNSVNAFQKQFDYNLGFGLHNFGAKMKYSNIDKKANLPSSIGLGGSVATEIVQNHNIGLAWDTQYYTDSKDITNAFGLEYELYNLVALRVGQFLDRGNVKTSVGLGINYRKIRLDMAYQYGNISNFSFGLAYHFN